MHYTFLSELGSQYNAEEGTAGVRVAALTATEGGLNNAIMELRALTAALYPTLPPNPTIAQRSAFMKQTLALTGKSVHDIQTPQTLAAKAKVERMKRWLILEGAELEEVGGQIRIKWASSARTVEYDRNASQAATRVRYLGGKLFSDDGCTKPFDTTNMVTHFSGPGYAIYVMSPTGDIHVDSHSVGHRHHSTLLAGQNVAGAGEMQIKNGKLLWISNKSGHYAPDATHFLQVLFQLQKNGVDLGTVKVKFLAAHPTPPANYDNVGLYLAAMQLNGLESYDYARLLRFLVQIPEAEFALLAQAKGWRWVDPAEIGMGKRGVVTIAGNASVPHKEVRQWLKSLGKTPTVAVAVKSGAGR